MTNSLEIGSHLCDGCVTDASRLTGPGPWADVVPGQQAPGRHRYPRLPPLVLCRRPAYPPGRTATQPIPARPCGTRWAACRLSAPRPL